MKGRNIKILLLALPFLLSVLSGEAQDSNMAPPFNPELSDPMLSSSEGAMFISGRNDFDLLAARGEPQGKLLMSEVKFLITDVQTDAPRLYFLNSSSYKYHWKFFSNALEWNMDLYSFNSRTYTDENRMLIAGSVVRYDGYTDPSHPDGVYTVEFWPSDPIHAADAHMVLSLLRRGMPYASDKLVYHPTGESQVRLHAEEITQFQDFNIDVVQTEELYQGAEYLALNTGAACGILRAGSSSGTYSSMDIVVFETIPNDISHVAGVVTTIPQTPLSHINLKARQNGTPNAFIQGFTETYQYRNLLNEYVRLSVYPGGYSISGITLAEANEWLESTRPDSITVLPGNFSERRILPLSELRLESACSFGAKAANIGELSLCLPSESVPSGFGIPFVYYRSFMGHNDFYQMIDSLTSLEEFNMSVESRDEILNQIRSEIRNGSVPSWITDSLSVMASQFEPQVSLRCRSSTNNEDLPGFNGAGLYESYTHHPDEGHISETVKQVWAGMWTYRAFEEREFHRIDHNSAAMGVVVHPSFRDEPANGVAVTYNIYNPYISGYYVNVQAGEDMVTNPQPESVPEEFLLTNQSVLGCRLIEAQYISFSNRIPEGERVLTEDQRGLLADYLEDIHRHFADAYCVTSDGVNFAMEIEFKILSTGELLIKQARPWVNGGS